MSSGSSSTSSTRTRGYLRASSSVPTPPPREDKGLPVLPMTRQVEYHQRRQNGRDGERHRAPATGLRRRVDQRQPERPHDRSRRPIGKERKKCPLKNGSRARGA